MKKFFVIISKFIQVADLILAGLLDAKPQLYPIPVRVARASSNKKMHSFE